ncbi:hypothetical protein DL93DRAFT_2086367 [Clavulina sp. PMI_390]|nr:hypothetical protein DL93DRAFT_2086367 [Clavulina sp. PMI_390]
MSSTHPNLNSLNVAALKALCKENGLSGYSKLSKQALIEKITGVVKAPNDLVPPNPADAPKAPLESTPISTGQVSKHNLKRKTPLTLESNSKSAKKVKLLDPKSSDPEALVGSSVNADKTTGSNLDLSAPLRSAPDGSAGTASSQIPTPGESHFAQTGTNPQKPAPIRKPLPATPSNSKAPQFLFSSTNTTRDRLKVSEIVQRPTPLLPPSKPFVKMLPSKPPRPAQNMVAVQLTTNSCGDMNTSSSYLARRLLSEPPEPRKLPLPPKISQRSQTTKLSVILSYLDDRSLEQCTSVCKSWRYAVYLSAQNILKRYYPGIRLTTYLEPFKTSLSQLDLWPYLRYRRDEVKEAQETFAGSYLHSVFGLAPISPRLWCCGDSPTQLEVALRFLAARTWLAINVGDQRVVKWTQTTIIDAQPVAHTRDGAGRNTSSFSSDADIWRITTRSGDKQSLVVYHVLGETGEIIGQIQDDDPFAAGPSVGRARGELRLDWDNLLASSFFQGGRILERTRWSGTDEYQNGISRHWLKPRSLQNASELQKAEKKVAERYILASVAGNSLSGRYQTATELAREFNGVPSADTGLAAKNPHATLYVPEFHFVESVHFTTGRGQPLHPALAVIQTPFREVFILRDTGSEVGTEEEGVRFVWMELLGCDVKGVARC